MQPVQTLPALGLVPRQQILNLLQLFMQPGVIYRL